jgi:hypothetical protein
MSRPGPGVNGASSVCDQKTFNFFVSHQEESMAGHVGIKGNLLKVREEKYKAEHDGVQVESEG